MTADSSAAQVAHTLVSIAMAGICFSEALLVSKSQSQRVNRRREQSSRLGGMVLVPVLCDIHAATHPNLIILFYVVEKTL